MEMNLAFLLIILCTTADRLHSFTVDRNERSTMVETENSTDDVPRPLQNVTEEEERNWTYLNLVSTLKKTLLVPSEVPRFQCTCTARNGFALCPEWKMTEGSSNDTSVVVKVYNGTKNVCVTDLTIHDNRRFPKSGKLFINIECHAGGKTVSKRIERSKRDSGDFCKKDGDCLSVKQKCLPLKYLSSYKTCQCPAPKTVFFDGTCHSAVRPSGICNYTIQCQAWERDSHCSFNGSNTVGHCACLYGTGSTTDSCSMIPSFPINVPLPDFSSSETHYKHHYTAGGVGFVLVFGVFARCCYSRRKRNLILIRSISQRDLVASSTVSEPVLDAPPSYEQVTTGHLNHDAKKASAP